MTFRQTAFTDGEDPADSALSSSILINITNDDIFEGVEYFQARIVETSDKVRVRIGQDTVNITITDSESSMFGMRVKSYISATIECLRIVSVQRVVCFFTSSDLCMRFSHSKAECIQCTYIHTL